MVNIVTHARMEVKALYIMGIVTFINYRLARNNYNILSLIQKRENFLTFELIKARSNTRVITYEINKKETASPRLSN